MKKDKKYYTKELDNYYKSIVTQLNDTIHYTELSFNDFVLKYFKHHTRDEFNKQIPLAKFHLDIVDKVEKSIRIELAVQMARNHAKSTVFSLFLPIYLMLKGETHFALLIGPNKELATKQLINIQTELETNTTLIKDFGEFTKKGNWAKGNFIVDKYQTAFFCAGKGQSTRGLKYKNYRPDLIVIDDIDTDKDVLSIKSIEKQTNWIYQSVFPAMSIKKYRFIILGNRFAPNMVLNNVMENTEGIEILKVNAIDDMGHPAWGERFTIDDLLRIKEKLGTIRFEREFMNNPIIQGAIFKSEWIQWFTLTSQNFKTVFTYIDPSFKRDGDFKAAITIGYKDNKYYILDIYESKTNMKNVFNYLYKIHKQWGANHRFYIEANFAQDLHKETFQKVSLEYGYNLPIIWDKSKKENKEARIETMSIYFEQGLIFFNDKLKNSNSFKQFYLEYSTFPTSKNDDGIDAMESCINVINKTQRKNAEILIGYREKLKLY